MPTLKYKDPVTGEYKSDIHVVGAVSSVNGKTGVVELTNSDISNAITDVQINGASVVTDGVANVPKATTDILGVVRGSTEVSVASNGVLQIAKATDTQISQRSLNNRPITSSNLDYAVKAAMTDGRGAAWTAAEQAAARTRMDAASQLDVDKLKAAAEGHLYMFQQDSTEAYEKSVPSDAMQWATLDSVGGKTLVWNQLAESKNTATFTSNGVTCTPIENGYSFTGTPTATFFARNTYRDVNLIAGHKYYVHFDHNVNAWSWEFYLQIYTSVDNQTLQTGDGSSISECLTTGSYVMRMRIPSGYQYDSFYIKNVMLVDLTAMFGAGNEPTTVEEFRAIFPADYYPYSEPTLMTYSPDKVQNSTGDTKDLSVLVRKYFPNGMKSAGDAHDEIDLEHGVAVQRIGNVDLGTQTWSLSSDGYFRTELSQRLWGRNIIRLICDRLVTASATGTSALSDNMITSSNTSKNIYAKDSSCDTVDAFRQKMSGATLYFELAAPIETPIDPADLADLAFLNVEAGGSLTFTNDQGADYHVALPNQETWMIKLPGVTA